MLWPGGKCQRLEILGVSQLGHWFKVVLLPFYQIWTFKRFNFLSAIHFIKAIYGSTNKSVDVSVINNMEQYFIRNLKSTCTIIFVIALARAIEYYKEVVMSIAKRAILLESVEPTQNQNKGLRQNCNTNVENAP